ncbi:MAG: hypothetical protein KJZ78_12520 [Bryobacteraceae bacterium]|nr:hypothetical protein [Bryobacterales bacterium]MCL4852191.1 hypothetical protein [Bryobacteraceae bacterium]
MMKKLVLLLVCVAVAVASAADTYKVTLFQSSIVAGTELKPGDYKLDLEDGKVVIRQGKTSVETKVKVENGKQKFAATSVRYENTDGKSVVQEIRLGGTTTTLVFN